MDESRITYTDEHPLGLQVEAELDTIIITMCPGDAKESQSVILVPDEVEDVIAAIRRAAAIVERPAQERRDRERLAALIEGRGIRGWLGVAT